MRFHVGVSSVGALHLNTRIAVLLCICHCSPHGGPRRAQPQLPCRKESEFMCQNHCSTHHLLLWVQAQGVLLMQLLRAAALAPALSKSSSHDELNWAARRKENLQCFNHLEGRAAKQEHKASGVCSAVHLHRAGHHCKPYLRGLQSSRLRCSCTREHIVSNYSPQISGR
jgi:hypothetical protein